MGTKLCPLKKTTTTQTDPLHTLSQSTDSFMACVERQCAWWIVPSKRTMDDEPVGHCAVWFTGNHR